MPFLKGLKRVQPEFAEALRERGVDSIEALSSREFGVAVTDHRSSWTRFASIGSTNVYIKTYDYPSARDRARGIGRTTFARPSRAAREWDALRWLDRNGFSAPSPLLLGEIRRFGFLRRAVLVTAAWDGEPLGVVLPKLDAGQRKSLLEAVVAEVELWHAAGFRDRNLDPRNLLVSRSRSDSTGWIVAKIDSPRHRIVGPGRRTDQLARADWERLARGLAAVGASLDEARTRLVLDP